MLSRSQCTSSPKWRRQSRRSKEQGQRTRRRTGCRRCGACGCGCQAPVFQRRPPRCWWTEGAGLRVAPGVRSVPPLPLGNQTVAQGLGGEAVEQARTANIYGQRKPLAREPRPPPQTFFRTREAVQIVLKAKLSSTSNICAVKKGGGGNSCSLWGETIHWIGKFAFQLRKHNLKFQMFELFFHKMVSAPWVIWHIKTFEIGRRLLHSETAFLGPAIWPCNWKVFFSSWFPSQFVAEMKLPLTRHKHHWCRTKWDPELPFTRGKNNLTNNLQISSPSCTLDTVVLGFHSSKKESLKTEMH